MIKIEKANNIAHLVYAHLMSSILCGRWGSRSENLNPDVLDGKLDRPFSVEIVTEYSRCVLRFSCGVLLEYTFSGFCKGGCWSCCAH